MSNVTLQIAGRSYKIACAEGEESHIEMLGAEIDSKLNTIPSMTGQSESHTLLFAALLMADALHDARQQAGSGQENAAGAAEPLEMLAGRLESLASRLEAGTTNT